ncbi:MAG: hypothetical protein R3D85_08530 [Paracoccaceae bacterium]
MPRAVIRLARAACVAWAALLPMPVPAAADVLDRLMGRPWSHVRPEGGACEEAFWFELNPERSRLTVRLNEPVPSRDIVGDTFHYQLREVHETTARMFLEHETWRDGSGQLVEWWLILLGPDSFAWRRSDWPIWNLTPLRYRCALPG